MKNNSTRKSPHQNLNNKNRFFYRQRYGGKIIVVLGPNASGKSELAVRLAKKFNGEIISADSRQIYKGLNIGSGKVEGMWKKFSIFNFQFSNKSKIKKPNSQTKKYFVYIYKDIVHHCIDFVNPKRVFSAYNFKQCGERALAEIFSRGKNPIICGGTGFYIDALLGNVNLAEISPDLNLRKKLEKKSCEELFKMLQKLNPHTKNLGMGVNPERVKNIDKQNKRRLVRAVEIAKSAQTRGSLAYISELTLSSKLTEVSAQSASKYRKVLYVGIKHPSEILKQRIEKRLKARLKHGMLMEVRDLRLRHKLSWRRLYDLGLEYRFASLFLRQKEKIQKSRKLSLKEKKVNIENAYADLILKIKTESWHYAKRQMTWFKRNKNIHWTDLTLKNLKEAEILTKKFLAN